MLLESLYRLFHPTFVGGGRLGFFGRFNPINAKVSVLLDKPTFLEGETVTGRLVLDSDEAVRADEIRLEVRITETYQAPAIRHVGRSVTHTMETHVKQIHAEDVRISGSLDISKGHKDEFPFSVNIPPARPTMPNGVINRKIKGVVAVKGRPDKTHEITVNVSYAPYAPAAAPAPAQVMVKEIVKVPCKYCGALIPIEATRCTNCGAKFTR